MKYNASVARMSRNRSRPMGWRSLFLDVHREGYPEKEKDQLVRSDLGRRCEVREFIPVLSFSFSYGDKDRTTG